MKVKDGAISRKQAVKALIGWDEEAKDEDIIFTLNNLPNVVPKKDSEPAIPLSVIEKITTEVQKKIDENLDSEGIPNEYAYCYESVLAIIDEAVKECEA